MGFGSTVLLGAIAGVTILLGLPVARIRRPMPELRLMLNAITVGVLVFLVWDVLVHAYEPIDTALGKLHDNTGTLGPVIGYAALFAVGLTVGLMGLVYYERLMARSNRRSAERVRSDHDSGLAAMGSVGLATRRAVWSPAKRLTLMIAVGIGLHNFAEGLAIGGSAAQGEIGLAAVLVIGFGLHNATEGFGIVAPLAADREAGEPRPTWGFLLAMGAIGGGPTFLGTALGYSFSSDAVSLLFLTLAAGSILYVVIQLLGVAAKAARKDLLGWGILIGLMAGFVTDFIVTAGGA